MGLAFQLSFNFFCKTLGNYASSQKVSVSQDTARSERSNLDTVRSEKSNLDTDRYWNIQTIFCEKLYVLHLEGAQNYEIVVTKYFEK